ncbi:NPC1-like intracellular cholesterol transporter 1 [Erpetoichthys calabaricus]|uniref:NPC1-like intracellular cholesterol transporter 1 n=1 Tax=Erpetoichthys calabaricus TaxID=27687 RepID=UPI002234116E|nr:NPC1-like intracellular cholesterol transporter 1 [Erpetoichthys calabaricus]
MKTLKMSSLLGFAVFQALLCLVASSDLHKEGYCTFYDECGENPTIENGILKLIIPCVYHGPAKKATEDVLIKLREVCPMLDHGNNTMVCCNFNQLKSLQESLFTSKAILGRCPSCVENFINIYCQNTCSPNQSLHINITKTINVTIDGQDKEAVLEYQAYFDRQFAEDSFNSCKSVRLLTTGNYAISAMCGKYGHTHCTTQRWLDYQGDSSNGLAPLDVLFKLINNHTVVENGIVPYNSKAWHCNESTSPNGTACSCLDCVQSCPVIPPPVVKDNSFTIGRADGVLVISIIIFCVLLLLFFSFVIYKRMCCFCKPSLKDPGHNSLVKPDYQQEPSCSEKVTVATQDVLGSFFEKWGTLIALHPVKVIVICLVLVLVFSVGMIFIKLTTDPVELWSAPESRARKEKDFHDKMFDPFFRTNQVILTAPNRPSYTYDSVMFGKLNFSGILSKDLILQLLELQSRIQAIEFWSDELGRNASLKDVCYAPLNPLNATLTDCAVNSLVQYFQNNENNIEAKANTTIFGEHGEVDWRDHFLYCTNSPLTFKDTTGLGLSCMADYGAPVFPFLAVGGYENTDYFMAQALILTFSLNNYPRGNKKFNIVEKWEQKYLEIIQEYQKNPSTNFTLAYMAERSLEDEINRTTAEDIPVFMISYIVIFIYIALALGEYSSCKRVLIDSKIVVGLGGILVVGCAVLSSMGFYAWIGIPSSLIILEVVPFLVLAVGADNVFIFVLELQRDERKPGEKTEEQIGRVLGSVAPSMLLCSLSESVCFFLGALSTMPAVKTFALYAALAVLFDFLLQMTAFVALLSLDAKRQEAMRYDVVCCIRAKSKTKQKKKNEGFLMPFMKKYYAPFLLNNCTRIFVMIIFLFMFCAAFVLMFKVRVGLDQELAMPKDSYMLTYFEYLYKYFEVGVPTYFVTTGGYNFSTLQGMNGVCASVGCDNNSLVQKIQYATDYPELSYLKIPANSWVDDFIDWLNPLNGCCRLTSNGTFCPSTTTNEKCKKCMYNVFGEVRPSVAQFNKFLPYFLQDYPNIMCSKGGLGAYDKAVIIGNDGEIMASRFMAYHTPLTNSEEFTAALQSARELADNITKSMRKVPGTDPNFQVFPYTITYVYYEQYLTIVWEGLFNLFLCLLPTFVVCCILLGMDVRSGFLNLLTIVMIIVDTVGVMTLWSIDYNAVSLINLVTAVGISVEFVSHLTRSFAISTQPTRVERAKEATAKMGSAVFAGVAMTNLPGIIVLAFAKAQLIQIFFFRLNLIITLLGMAHGLIFLPVLLSYFGPNINNSVWHKKKEVSHEGHFVDGAVHETSAGYGNGTFTQYPENVLPNKSNLNGSISKSKQVNPIKTSAC